MSLAKQRFREELRLVNEYMRMKALPPELRDRVREYYDLRFREGKMFDEKQILSKTSTPLRNEILQYNSRELKEIVPLLMNTPSELFKALSLHFEPGISAASDMIMHEGSDSSEQGICFILSGSAEMLAPQVKLKIGQRRNSTSDEHKAERIALIGDGCYFGDVATVLGCKRTASVRACTVLVCYSLDTNAISKVGIGNLSTRNRTAMRSLARSLARSLVRSLTRSLVRSLARSLLTSTCRPRLSLSRTCRYSKRFRIVASICFALHDGVTTASNGFRCSLRLRMPAGIGTS